MTQLKDEWRTAGEIFGILQESLGFGDLAMYTLTPGVVVYQWEFNAKHERIVCEESAQLAELHDVNPELFATVVVDRWKNYHRRAAGEVIA